MTDLAGAISERGDTAANWTSNNPVLAENERGLETDTGLSKVGNSAGDNWNDLVYEQRLQAFQISETTDGSGDIDVTFPNEFEAAPRVNVQVIRDSASQVTALVLDTVSTTGCTIRITSNDAAVTGVTIKADIWAYGTWT